METGHAYTKQLFLTYLKLKMNKDSEFANPGSPSCGSTLQPCCKAFSPCHAAMGPERHHLALSTPAQEARLAAGSLVFPALVATSAPQPDQGRPGLPYTCFPSSTSSSRPPTVSQGRKLEPGEWASPHRPQAWLFIG